MFVLKNQSSNYISQTYEFISRLLSLNNTEELKYNLEEKGISLPQDALDDFLAVNREIAEGKLPQRTIDLIYNVIASRIDETSHVNDSELASVSGGAHNSKKKFLSKSLAGLLAFGSVAACPAPAHAGFLGIMNNTLSNKELKEIRNQIIAQNVNSSELADILGKYDPKQKQQIVNFILKDGAAFAVSRLRNFQQNAKDDVQKNDMDAAFFGVDTGKQVYADLAKAAKIALPAVAGIFILKSSTDITENLKNFYVSGSNSVKRLLYKLSHKGIDVTTYQTTLARIEKRLRNELVGQDKAIDRILEILTGYFESMLEAKALGKKFEGGLLLYLTGSPATGKSTTMKIIEEEMGLRSYVGRMSDAVEDRGNGAQTVATRLTKPVIKDNGKVKVSVDTQLTQQIRTKIPTLYCFDEVDKMRNLDSVLQKRSMRNENGKIIGGSVDEMLRNFGDTGQINGQDVSGSVLIATSNETQEQLKELEESLYNRYKGCNVQFSDFTKKDYIEIMNRKSKDILEFYKNQFNVTVSWDKSALDHYSEKFEKENSGGRGVDTLMNDVRFAIKTFQTRNEKLFKNCKVSIFYDASTDKLFVR